MKFIWTILLAIFLIANIQPAFAGPFDDDDGDGQINLIDCASNDPTLWTHYWFNVDNDDDGYGVFSIANIDETCDGAGALPPAGYADNNDDCDDTDPTWWFNLHYDDADADGYGDVNDVNPIQSCNATEADHAANDNTDCDDTDAAVNPAADEVCGDAIDNDCDGATDDSNAIDATQYYNDVDTDGFGDDNDSQFACTQPVGYIIDNTDCDDTDAAIFPGAVEVCDGVDNDCDATIDEGFDSDNDGTADCFDTEECDGVDNNGDGNIDEGVQNTYYQDADGDNYGNAAVTQDACTAPNGFVASNTDCDDTDANINPGGTDVCEDGTDQDCDGNDATCPAPADDDGDGVENDADNCPNTFNDSQSDADGDGIGDDCDDDDDGDGVNDNEDAFPWDPNESADTDGDGIGDNADPDADGNGFNDTTGEPMNPDANVTEEPTGDTSTNTGTSALGGGSDCSLSTVATATPWSMLTMLFGLMVLGFVRRK